LLIARGGEQSNRLVAFDVLPVGSRLFVVDPSVAESGERKILVVARGSLRDPSEADVDGATMISYDFVPDGELDASDVAAFSHVSHRAKTDSIYETDAYLTRA
jgi:hypothetical protein